MKTTLNFEYDDQDEFDRVEIHRILNATKLALCIWDIEQVIRKVRKYDTIEMTEEVKELISQIEQTIADSIGNIDEFIS